MVKDTLVIPATGTTQISKNCLKQPVEYLHEDSPPRRLLNCDHFGSSLVEFLEDTSINVSDIEDEFTSSTIRKSTKMLGYARWEKMPCLNTEDIG